MRLARKPEATQLTPEMIVVSLERSHAQLLFGFARRLGLSPESSSDVVQEALLRLFHVLSDGTVVADPAAWAFHAAYRLAMDEHRRAAVVSRFKLTQRPKFLDAADPADDHDRASLWAEVDRLPARQRAVLFLRYRADFPFDDIASVLGISPSAARSHATQAIAALRRNLDTGGHA